MSRPIYLPKPPPKNRKTYNVESVIRRILEAEERGKEFEAEIQDFISKTLRTPVLL